jgi:hypothetical protein
MNKGCNFDASEVKEMSSLEKWMAIGSAVLVMGSLITLVMLPVQAISPPAQPPTLKPAGNLGQDGNKTEVPPAISQVLIPAAAPTLTDPPRRGFPIFRAAPKPVAEIEPLRAAPRRLATAEPILRVAYNPLAELEPLRSTPKPFDEQGLRVAKKPLSEPEILRGAPKPVAAPEILRSAPRPIPQQTHTD